MHALVTTEKAGKGQGAGELPSGQLGEDGLLLPCISPQVTQLQVEMGAPGWAMTPEIASQKYSEVGPCP